MTGALASFIDAVDGYVHDGGDGDGDRDRDATKERLVRVVAASLRSLFAHRGWLDDRVSRPVSGKPYSQYLLHVAPDSSWSLVSFVWPAGSSTPIHDHGCWGVVGVYQGEETETAFRVAGDREPEGSTVDLERGATTRMRPGDVTTILPPDDVHRVSNDGSGTAISIHVYGADIGTFRRHSFHPDTGKVSAFVSGYDRPASL
jgi:3-mercaptopropionate dioxygenase